MKVLVILLLVAIVFADTSCCSGERCVFTTGEFSHDDMAHLCNNDVNSCKINCDNLPPLPGVEVETVADLPVPESDSLQCVARSTILARGKSWIDARVPYSQSKFRDGYRTDCSGFVSMSWMLPKPGATTRTISNYATSISKGQLQPGDALLGSGHVVIFAGWADGAKTKYHCYEESSSKGAVSRVTPYPYWSGSYSPIRLRGVC
ncbi:hypothetical protein RCL1_000914 [Eukaryota sp. TZLM3-RCL]